MSNPLLIVNSNGLYCPAGDFYIDPWRPVERAVITHGHSDHARFGSQKYLTHQHGIGLLRARLGNEINVSGLDWNESITLNGVSVSLHPAGHVLGSAQVRVESAGEVWVVSGDYKLAADPTCKGFEPVHCHTFVTESTFGLPIYRWPPGEEVISQVNQWWKQTADSGTASVICGYSLGKAQRILAGLDANIGPIYTHGAVERMNEVYRAEGVELPKTLSVFANSSKNFAGAIIVSPPSAVATPWLRRFGDYRLALASGWMAIRGARRRRAVDRGFVLSDHADWPGLLSAIRESRATRVLVTHGYTGPLVRWLREQGLDSVALQTAYEGERMEGDPDASEPESVQETPSESAVPS